MPSALPVVKWSSHYSSYRSEYGPHEVWNTLATLLFFSTDAGILACFVGFAAQGRKLEFGLTGLGIALATLLCTLSLYSIGRFLGPVAVAFSMLLLMAYIQRSAEVQKELGALVVK